MKKFKMMKRFKFWLVGLILFGLSVLGFSSADFTGSYYCPNNCNFTFNIFDSVNSVKLTDVALSNDFGNMKLRVNYSARADGLGTIYQKDFDAVSFNTSDNCSSTIVSYCKQITKITVYGCNGNSCTINSVYTPNSTCPECQECETCPTTGEVLSGACDTNYCVENDLCPVADNFSQIFINEIEHQSAPVIDITIPLEYAWESSINSGVFDLTISGNNVDYDYIDNIIRTQQSKPNSVDFNNIVSGLIPLLIPGLVIILFIWFIFRFIKKIF